MDKTSIMVEFIITGDQFPPNVITEMLSIEPTGCYMKGEKVKNKGRERKETCWYISTGYEDSLDINNQLKKIMNLIGNQKQMLLELKNKYDLDYMFSIVIRVEQNQTPAINLKSETIEFASDINAEFDLDLYIF